LSRQLAPTLLVVALLLPVAGAFPPDTVPASCYVEHAFPGLDVVFLLDLTGSMGGVLSSAKAESVAIMRDIAANVSDVRFGASSHMDYPAHYDYPGYSMTYGVAGVDYPYRLDQDLTTDTSLVSGAIDGMTLGNGYDGPEAYTRAIYESTVTPAWGAPRIKVVVFFADNVPHDLDWHGRNTGGDPGRDAIALTADDLDWETTVAQMGAAGVRLVGINSGGAQEMMMFLADSTAGNWTTLSSGSDFHKTVVDMVLGVVDPPTPKDTTPPTISVDAPAPGRLVSDGVDLGVSPYPETTVLAGDLGIGLSASDDCKLRTVTLNEGGARLASWTDLPLAYTYPASTATDGVHVLTATATDWVGQTAVATISLRIVHAKESAHAQGVFVGLNVPASLQLDAGVARATQAPQSESSLYGARSLAGSLDYASLRADATTAAAGTTLSANATSRVEKVTLLGGRIVADAIEADSRSTFDITTLVGASSPAGSSFARLVIDGTPVEVTAPNTEVALPGLGYVRLFEVTTDADAVGTMQQVNMIHAFADTPSLKGEVIVASARTETRLGAQISVQHRDINDVDDAGTDRDAGDSTSTAIPLTPGVYAGRVGGDDVFDAYSFPAGEGDRIALGLVMAQQVDAALLREPSTPPPDAGIVADQRPTHGALMRLIDPRGVTRDSTALAEADRIEFNADVNGTWTAVVSQDEEPSNYTLALNLSAVQFLPGDDLAGDAGATCADALRVDDGLHAGVMRIGDDADAWTWHADLGDVVAAAVKPDELDDGANFDLYLYDPHCYLVAQSQLGQPTDLVPKGAPDSGIQVPAKETGLYTVVVVRESGVGNYYLGLGSQQPIPTVAPIAATETSGPGDAQTLAAPAALVQGSFPDTSDDEDWYVASAPAGQTLRLAVEGGVGNVLDVTVYDASLVAVGHGATQLGVPVAFTQPAGTYYLQVQRTLGGGNYLVSAIVAQR
jgi:hypothetical protein